MEVQEERQSFDDGDEDPKEEQPEVVEELQQKLQEVELGGRDAKVLRFLDSVDDYLTLIESLSSTLRQGWLELASARHSMGASRISTVLLDLKVHSAATSLHVDYGEKGDSVEGRPHFTLCKWVSSKNRKCSPEDENHRENKLHPQLRYRGNLQLHEEETLPQDRATHKVDDQVEKERKKSLSVFGALVSPKLRAAQLTFEGALETLVEIANMRAAMLSAFDQVQKELGGTQG
ncbi:hypothetical protein SLEP1_g51589 [Rubroshorea leprosula]|uniref:Vacuolar ATPase assembly protein VMA22 n=1 Tax=Rubroshorea leprosula TaxID=152421 RepID=A0AAV5M4J6_9ROSI|nr:hypothetical protein SLEP1_g51589 [Rubroshorea leprosula]